MYRIVKFETVNLEFFNQVDTIGSGPVPTAYHILPDGGALDLFGSQQKHPGAVERVKSIRLRGTNQDNLQDLYFQLLSLRGTRGKLYRSTMNGQIHWQYARLVEVSARRSYEQAQFHVIQDLDLRFVTQDVFWRGAWGGLWYFNNGEYLDTGLVFDSGHSYILESSPADITLSIGEESGRGVIRSVRIQITAIDGDISDLIVSHENGETLHFYGTIHVGDTLVIDTGTMQVRKSGDDAYADLELSPTADMAAWFVLKPGENQISVEYEFEGGATVEISFEFYEAWY